MVLAGVMSGFGTLLFDSGAGGRSSRLYRALVDGGLATEIDASFRPSIDPTVFHVFATVRSGVEIAAVENAVDQELQRLRHETAEPEELERVNRQAKAQFVYLRDGVFRRALALGAYTVVGWPDALSTLPELIEGVTVEDVMRAASTYLVDRHRTVGWYVPENGAGRAGLPS